MNRTEQAAAIVSGSNVVGIEEAYPGIGNGEGEEREGGGALLSQV